MEDALDCEEMVEGVVRERERACVGGDERDGLAVVVAVLGEQVLAPCDLSMVDVEPEQLAALVAASDEVEGPAEYAAPTAGAPPYEVYEVTPGVVFGFATDDRFDTGPATRWRF